MSGQVSEVDEFFREGALDDLKPGEFGIVIGDKAAAKLGVAVGDKITFADIAPEVAGVYPAIMKDGDMDAGGWSCGCGGSPPPCS